MVKNIIATAAIAASLAAASAAHAGTIGVGLFGLQGTLTATSAVGATSSPFALGNFGTAGINGLVSTGTVQIANGGTVNFTPNNSTPQAGVYSGSTQGVATSPYNGTGLTPANYLVAEPNDPATINFGANRSSFSLLWGSVDSFNSLDVDFLMAGVSVLEFTVSGTQVATAVGGGFAANGSNSAFVTLTSIMPFNQVVVRSTNAAFEFNPSVQVPEPASMALLGASLAGIGLIRRKKNAA